MADTTARLRTALADRYAIQEELGAGGMATVYLAEDLKHHRKVAVKVLRPELAAVLGAERFVQEIETTANLQHPHILPLFDSGEADGFLYYVMPYIEGETLRDKLNRETQLGIEEAVGITTDVADALDSAHQQGVIHRDIKPENILLHDGRPMVADFGIALAVSAAAGGRMTETGLSLGTPHYMSPEQATAERDLTNRSDIYSLGCVLYEMLTGSPPHVGSTAQQIIMKIVTEEVPPVTKARKTVPPNVAAAVAKSLEKLPADRFASAARFGHALNDPGFVLASSERPTASAVDQWRAKPVLVMAVIAIVLAVIAVLGWLRPSWQGSRMVTRLTLDLRDPKRQTNDYGPTVVISPDGSRIAYHGPDREWWIRPLDGLSATRVPEMSGAQKVVFSPGGNEVLYRQGGWLGILTVQSLSGDRLEVVGDSVSDDMTWGADGWIYFTAFDQTLARVPATGGMREPLTQIDTTAGEVSHFLPFLIPNGRGLLFSVSHDNAEDRRIAVLDLADGTRKTLMRGLVAQYVSTGHLVFARNDGALMAAPFDARVLTLTGEAVEIVAATNRTGGADIDAWAPDLSISDTGTLVYVTRGADDVHELVWLDRSGRVASIDSSLGGRVRYPRLSADGSRLAMTIFRPGPNVWVKDLETGSLTKLTFGNVLDYRPHWYAGDSAITFVAPRPPEQLAWDLYTVPAAGGADSLVLDLPNEIHEAFWSPDEEWLVFQHEITDLGDLGAVRRGATDALIALTDTRTIEENNLELSPDGRWLAYESNKFGRPEVYVRGFPDTSAMTQVSLEGGSDPVWGRNGRELFYVNARQELVVADVTSDGSFTVRSRRPLFSVMDYRWDFGYDVTPDGQQFILIRGRDEAPGQVVLVQNFFEELNAKVGN